MTSEELRKTFSSNIKKYRKIFGLTQMMLAEKADISVGYLCDLEAGNKWATPETIVKLADALNLKPFQLFENDTTKESPNLYEDIFLFSSRLKEMIDSETLILLNKAKTN